MLFRRDSNSVLLAILSVAILTFLGRFVGVFLDSVLAVYFGEASGQSDAFFLAIRIPRFLRSVLGDNVFGAALLPALVGLISLKNYTKASQLVLTICLGVFSLFSFLWIMVALWPAFVTGLFAPGLPESTRYYFIAFLPKVFGYIVFISVCEVLSVALKSYGHFFVPASGPIFQSVFLIGITIFASKFSLPVSYLAWGFTLVAFLKLIIRAVACLQVGFKIFVPISVNIISYDVYQVLKKMLPSLIGFFGVAQLQVFVEGFVGSYLACGEISILHYVFRVFHLFLFLIIAPVSSVILPYFSENNYQSRERLDYVFLETSKAFLWLLGIMFFVLFLVSENIFFSFFQKNMVNDLVVRSSSMFRILLLGMPCLVFNSIFNAYLFAKGNTTVPAKINFLATCVSSFGFIIGRWLWGLKGIVIFSSIGAFFQVSMLYRYISREVAFDFSSFCYLFLRIVFQQMFWFIPLLYLKQQLVFGEVAFLLLTIIVVPIFTILTNKFFGLSFDFSRFYFDRKS